MKANKSSKTTQTNQKREYIYVPNKVLLKALVDYMQAIPKGRNKPDEFWATCPYCAVPKPTEAKKFNISERGHNCFICSQGGGLWKLAQHLGIADTIKEEYRRDAGTVTTRPYKSQLERAIDSQKTDTTLTLAQIDKDENLIRIFGEQMAIFRNNLTLATHIHPYLESQGYTPQTWTHLGYNPGWLDIKGYSIGPGIVYAHTAQNGEIMGLRIRAPYKTKDGKPDGLAKAMAQPAAKTKYISARGSRTSAVNYGWLSEEQERGYLIFVEGEKDTDNVWHALQDASVPILGVFDNKSGISPDLATSGILERSSGVLVLADNDSAGRAYADKLRTKLLQFYNKPIHMASVPIGKDATDYAITAGHDALGTWITEQLAKIPHRIETDAGYFGDVLDPAQIADYSLVDLIGQMGTGKTQFIGQYAEQQGYNRVVLISFRESLNRASAADLASYGFVSQYDVDEELWASQSRIVITVNSLPKYLDAIAKEPLIGKLLLVIDESNQVAAHLDGGTFKDNEGGEAHAALHSIAHRARQVICADANMGENTVALLAHLAEVDKRFVKRVQVVNPYQPPRPTVYMYNHPYALDEHIDERLINQETDAPILIMSDSPNDVEKRGKRLENMGYRVLKIHRDLTSEDDVRTFLQNPNNSLQLYDVIIASPSIASGISITGPISDVFAINHGRVVPAEITLQQIGRARNISGGIHVYVAPDSEEDRKPTEPQDIANEIFKANKTIKTIVKAELGYNGLWLSDENIPLLKQPFFQLAMVVRANTNRQLNSPLSTFIQLARKNGYTLQAVEQQSSKSIEHYSRQYGEIRDVINDEFKAAVLAAEPVDDETADHLRRQNKLEQKHHYGNIRYRIERGYGQTLIPEVLEHWISSGRNTRAIQWFTNIALKPDILRALDADEDKLELNTWDYSLYLYQRHGLAGILAPLFKFERNTDLTPELAEANTFGTDELKELHRRVTWEDETYSAPLSIKRIFGVDPTRYNSGATFLRALLKVFGLRLKTVEKGIYQIEADSLRKMIAYRQARLAAKEQAANTDVSGLMIYSRKFKFSEQSLNKPVMRSPKRGDTPPPTPHPDETPQETETPAVTAPTHAQESMWHEMKPTVEIKASTVRRTNSPFCQSVVAQKSPYERR